MSGLNLNGVSLMLIQGETLINLSYLYNKHIHEHKVFDMCMKCYTWKITMKNNIKKL